MTEPIDSPLVTGRQCTTCRGRSARIRSAEVPDMVVERDSVLRTLSLGATINRSNARSYKAAGDERSQLRCDRFADAYDLAIADLQEVDRTRALSDHRSTPDTAGTDV